MVLASAMVASALVDVHEFNHSADSHGLVVPSLSSHPANPSEHSSHDLIQPSGRPIIGFAINFHYNDDQQRYLEALDEIAELGCNAVLFSTPAFMTNGAASRISLEVGPDRGDRKSVV